MIVFFSGIFWYENKTISNALRDWITQHPRETWQVLLDDFLDDILNKLTFFSHKIQKSNSLIWTNDFWEQKKGDTPYDTLKIVHAADLGNKIFLTKKYLGCFANKFVFFGRTQAFEEQLPL